LNLAIYAGHGDFPRIVLAPGDTDECIVLGQAAFALADRFQIPVTLLSDQYLADSLQLTGEADFEAAKAPALIATEASYRRYAITETGISPRGVPGYGEGLICCDSDEHDERGQITESYAMRNAMVAKRHRKQNAVLASVPLPEIWGEGSIAVVGWGSTKRVIREVLAQTGDPRLFHVHFSWVFPLSPESLEVLQTAGHIIVVENNSDAQFAMQLCRHGIRVDHSVLQSDGFPFFADRLAEHFQSLPKELS
jgi:2-oxoglutarate ferredoxin oxidoreductase subunit alpha